jgi:hypothetical protein
MRGTARFLLSLLPAVALAACASVPASPPGPSGIFGKVVMKDTSQAVPGAYAYVYRDFGKNFVGVSDYISRASDADGIYRMEVPPGVYGAAARKRGSGASYGPLSTGDDYDNRSGQGPVKVKAGEFTRVDFALVAMREPMFFKRNPSDATDSGVRGRIVDEKGAPVPGAFAIAYDSADMKRLPDFASTLTNDDGRFTLYLPGEGRYWLGARIHIRDMPRPEEPYGLYEGAPDHSAGIVKGRFLEGVEIVVRPFKGNYIPGKVQY